MNAFIPHSSRFEANRSRLNSIAYRMLGSRSEAEDVVQDAYLRWRRVPSSQIESAEAYLTTVVSRLCVDRQRRRKVEKAIYTGYWLPEPVDETSLNEIEDPAVQLEQKENLSMGFMVLLEKLTPLERAVFVLKEAFDLDHEQIAAVFGIKSAYSRQLLRRARQRIKNTDIGESNTDPTPVVEQFLAASATGDMDKLRSLLSDDVIAYSDGGGRASAALIPLEGRDRVLTVLLHLMAKEAHLTMRWQQINGKPGLVFHDGESLHSTHQFTLQAGRIHRIFTMRNPDKLRHVE